MTGVGQLAITMTIAVTELALPPLSPPNTYISDILPRRKHDINDLAHEVRRSFEASTDLRSLLSLSAKLHGQIEQKLRAPGLCMLPSWNYKLPTGLETGTILALDVGGSTCRAAIVHLHGRSAVDGVSAHILLARTHCIDAQVRKMQGPAFFAWLADRVAGLLAEPALLGCSSAQQPLPIGLSWSFPIQYAYPYHIA